MIGSGIDPQFAARQADTKDLVRFKQEMDGLKDRLAGDGKDSSQKLRQACEKFEAVFISKLWKEMKSTVKKEGYLHSKQEDQYMSMFDREFAEKMSRSGGIGLADMIYDQLSEKLKETSRDALAGGVRIKPVKAEPIALNRGGTPIALPKEKQGLTLEDWGGSEGVGEQTSGVVSSSGEVPVQQSATQRVLTDVDVQAQLEILTRKLEAERIREGLLGKGGTDFGYGRKAETDGLTQLGRKLAKNG
ncbi:rod-binding protein [uncultured Pseudodesulfovibrio sp.]|uniref:rod-binding protein n=1 Tax=uncultured Pseudodesulfovibrio sp. TaxID=2035858 RepID=UPI0029C9393E|nr:rod-binding protein [uncultured Pseudodesulfovibrio sp.]